MTTTNIKDLLREYKRGTLSEDQVIRSLSSSMVESLGHATLDHHREMRQGFPEVIFCDGKTEGEVAEIAGRIIRHGSILLATRATKKHYAAVRRVARKARYNEIARTITANEHLVTPRGHGTILVVTAGTSDRQVAEEALETARMMGNITETLIDVGVAGIHRLLGQSRKLRDASVIIVVAGMDGALPSVVGGIVDVPVIAVPTSVGYGANFGGLAPLLTMLNSCAAGVTVVNIDNGFGAGFAASTINRKR
ncbi:MAG: nickel pincer cofactor biosynthesis protein LarB [Ignavibacteriae bacterium]|nr:nickel pincer cofactor biosynthesis protein LarB [Ignavibacteriota bacterium]